MFFNFRFQNTQNKPFSRQITLVGGSVIPPEHVPCVKKYFEDVRRQLRGLFWWNDAQNRKISLFGKREILRFWASFHQKSAHSCRGTFSKYFLTLETRSGGINDLSTNVLWREDVLFCVFWKRKLKDTSQATFWRFSGGDSSKSSPQKFKMTHTKIVPRRVFSGLFFDCFLTIAQRT